MTSMRAGVINSYPRAHGSLNPMLDAVASFRGSKPVRLERGGGMLLMSWSVEGFVFQGDRYSVKSSYKELRKDQ